MNIFTELIDIRDTVNAVIDPLLKSQPPFVVEATIEEMKKLDELQEVLTSIEMRNTER